MASTTTTPNKDKIFWVTVEESKPEIGANINWNCPCIPEEIKKGPCRNAFAISFECFLNSKFSGKTCNVEFQQMVQCLTTHNISLSKNLDMEAAVKKQ